MWDGSGNGNVLAAADLVVRHVDVLTQRLLGGEAAAALRALVRALLALQLVAHVLLRVQPELQLAGDDAPALPALRLQARPT